MTFFINVFAMYKKFQLNVIKKPKKVFEKRLDKGIKIFLKKKAKKKKQKKKKKLTKGIKMFLKRKKKNSANIIMNDIEIFLKTKNKG